MLSPSLTAAPAGGSRASRRFFGHRRGWQHRLREVIQAPLVPAQQRAQVAGRHRQRLVCSASRAQARTAAS